MIQEKTPTPYPFIETLSFNSNEIMGWVGLSYEGSVVPEPNAYIYIFINGLCINEPLIDKNGVYLNVDTAVFSDNLGYWRSSRFLLVNFPDTHGAQTIYFKAKSANKEISDRSVPHVIGGMATPVNLGVMSQFNEIRAPYSGEASLTGNLAYWLYSIPNLYPYNIWYLKKGLSTTLQGTPIFGCNTDIHIYSDEAFIGKVENNHVIGKDVIFPLILNKNYLTPLYLSINNKLLTINFDTFVANLKTVETLEIAEATEEGLSSYTAPVKTDDEALTIYIDGYRQIMSTSFYIYLNAFNSNYYSVNFTSILPYATRVEGLYYNLISEFAINELLSDGTERSSFTLSTLPYSPETLLLFLNGRLVSRNDYTLIEQEITLSYSISTTDNLIADYQHEGTIRYTLIERIIPTVISSTEYRVGAKSLIGKWVVFVGGLLADSSTYTITEANNVVTAIFETETFDTVEFIFFVHPIFSSQLINYINNYPNIVSSCITAKNYNPPSIKPFLETVELESETQGNSTIYFLRPTIDNPEFVIYKNGRRLCKDYDFRYYEDSKIIVFTVSLIKNTLDDDIIEVYAYDIDLFKIGEKFFGNDVQTTYTLLESIQPGTVPLVFLNGQKLHDITFDEETLTITFSRPLEAIDIIVIDYQLLKSEDIINEFIPAGTIDGINRLFSIPITTLRSKVFVYKNGLKQQDAIDYVLKGTNLFFNTPIDIDDVLQISVIKLFLDSYLWSVQIELQSNAGLDIINGTSSIVLDTVVPSYIFYINEKLGEAKDLIVIVNGKKLPYARTSYITDPITGEQTRYNFRVEGLQNKLIFMEQFKPTDYVVVTYASNNRNTILGNYYQFPAKDENNDFLFYFNIEDGSWKYTNLNWSAFSNEEIVYNLFTTGQHLTARALYRDN